MDNNKMDRYLGRTLDNRYEVQKVLGKGGMAVVYKAYDHLLHRAVAMKILRDDMAADAEFRSRFQAEAQAVAMLSHPNIVSVYDVSRQPDVDYIVMELIEGITLKQYMKSKGQLDCKESVHFAVQVARALSHAHSKGIVHRDIKPQNIMINMDGSSKVADFGIAYLESTQAAETGGTAIGSVHYISPEQARGQQTDARSDLYSLGVVMYEMLTGQLPYTGTTAKSIALQHVSSTPIPPRDLDASIPPELEEITLRAMEADRHLRYQTADEMLADLEKYRLSQVQSAALDEEAEKALVPKDVEPIGRSGELSRESYARRRRRANKVSLLSGLFLVIVAILGVFSFLWNYWLADIFADPVRLTVPKFVGDHYEDIINNEEFKDIYRFTIEQIIDPDTQEGIIVSQSPEAGKSVMQSASLVPIQLTVSMGMQMVKMPNVVNSIYSDAVAELQKYGFEIIPEFKTSSQVTKDYVISTNPEAGEELPAGSRVYVTVSEGAVTGKTKMPNLLGLTESQAVQRLESNRLVLGSVSTVPHAMPAGTVVWQSVDEGVEVEEHTKIFLQISSGPSSSGTANTPSTPDTSDAPEGQPGEGGEAEGAGD